MNYSIWLLTFSILSYIIITDASVAKLFILTGERIRLQYIKLKWILFHMPDNPLVRWRIHRNSLKMAKELQKELNKKNRG